MGEDIGVWGEEIAGIDILRAGGFGWSGARRGCDFVNNGKSGDAGLHFVCAHERRRRGGGVLGVALGVVFDGDASFAAEEVTGDFGLVGAEGHEARSEIHDDRGSLGVREAIGGGDEAGKHGCSDGLIDELAALEGVAETVENHGGEFGHR